MTETPVAARSQIRLLLAAVFLAYLAQMTLNPVIAPLSRAVGLAEWQVGLTISVAALMVVVTSQWWGRRSQSAGRKPVLVSALVIAAAAMTGFAAVAILGMSGAVSGVALFVGFLALRGVGFGGGLAAMIPTAQAYIADVTDDPDARVKGMSGLGAVQGMAMIMGSVLGGVLAIFGLTVAVIAVPVLLLGGVVLVATRLRREPRTGLIEQPRRVRPLDPRVWPYLVAGFGLFTALGFIQVVTGFLVQDRLDVAGGVAGALTGVALLAAGLGMVVAQTVIVPRSAWSPRTLLRAGAVTALVGFVLLAPDAGAVPLFAGIGCIGLGLGVAMPGYSAGPSLSMDRAEQGGLAGLLGATTGLTFVVAPTLGTALYGIWGPLPVIAGGAVCAAVSLFVWVSPSFADAARPTG